MKIGIVGSRNYNALDKVREVVQMFPADTIVISGGARGVDSTAENEAKRLGLQVISYRPDYAKHGRSAPLIRNTTIIENSDKVIAFWDGISTGTQDSIRKAKIAGKETIIIQEAQ